MVSNVFMLSLGLETIRHDLNYTYVMHVCGIRLVQIGMATFYD